MVPVTNDKSWSAQDTTDTYASLGTAWQKPDTLHAIIVIKNEHVSNGAKVKVLGGAVRGVYPKEVLTETTIAAGASHVLLVSDYYPFLDIQIKAAVDSSQASVSAEGRAIAA